MDRRLFLATIAATAWGQQPAPTEAEAEKALRARASQFYQLEVDGKFRQAEAFVAEDTKDYYFDHNKPNLLSYKLGDIEFKDPTHAAVTLITTVRLMAPGIGVQIIPAKTKHTWKLDNGEWCWYIDQNAEIETPFGKIRPAARGATEPVPPFALPDVGDINKLVSIDRTTIDLSSGKDSVTITNQLPGAVTLEIGADHPKGLVVEADKTTLGKGETAVVSFRLSGDTKPTGSVRITVMPLGREFVIQIQPSGSK